MQLERAAREVHQGKRDLEDALTETQVGAGRRVWSGRRGCGTGFGQHGSRDGFITNARRRAGTVVQRPVRASYAATCAHNRMAAGVGIGCCWPVGDGCPPSSTPCRRPRESWARRPRTSAACTLSAPSCWHSGRRSQRRCGGAMPTSLQQVGGGCEGRQAGWLAGRPIIQAVAKHFRLFRGSSVDQWLHYLQPALHIRRPGGG